MIAQNAETYLRITQNQRKLKNGKIHMQLNN